jgi:hypothetical protein
MDQRLERVKEVLFIVQETVGHIQKRKTEWGCEADAC